jgi:L-amino acid N-acyltransferase YncA
VKSFVAYTPDAHGIASNAITIEPISPDDVTALAALLGGEGETPEALTARAEKLMVQVEPLLVAKDPGAGAAIGWTGMVHRPLRSGDAPVPLVAGLTVSEGWRRKGIALRLLTELRRVDALERPDALLHSVINMRNRASIDAHRRAGFREVARGHTFADITFDGGSGLGVLVAAPATHPAGR